MNNMKIENWRGYDIRFVELEGEWWAVLKDICDALKLRTDKIASRLDPSMLEKLTIEQLPTGADHLSRGVSYTHKPVKQINRNEIGKDLGRKSGQRRTQTMYVVNEIGIYEALFASRKLEARKFRMWAASVISKLRKGVGLEGYEVMRMTEPEVQEMVDNLIDTIYWDEERGCLMQSITVAGGDVDQVPFE